MQTCGALNKSTFDMEPKEKGDFNGQHGSREGFSCESQVISLFQGLSDEGYSYSGGTTGGEITDFAKAFDLVPHEKKLV